MSKQQKLKVAFLSAECSPFIKVGGLGDVVGSLPPALQKHNVQVSIFLPLNKDVSLRRWQSKRVGQLDVKYEDKSQKVEIYKTKLPNSSVPVYFLSNKNYFDKEDVYSGELKKFLFYSLASLEAMKMVSAPSHKAGRRGGPAAGWKPDIIHCHDHQTGMVASLMQRDRFFEKSKVVFTIHNLSYQGKGGTEILKAVDLDIKKFIVDDGINFMAQGILTADTVTTVSPTYAKEILTKEFGCGLEGILRKRKKDLSGILNGIDADKFNPATDKNLKYNYSIKIPTLPTGGRDPDSHVGTFKHLNKVWLQKKLGLPVGEDKCLVGFVSRLVWQKGVDLITALTPGPSPTPGVAGEGSYSNLRKCQFIVLGTGEKRYEEQLVKLAKKYPQNFSVQIKFDIKLAQQIYAGSDIFLMPSRYEPCGLGQMIAMRYGAVPVVRAVGGLRDTVFEVRSMKYEGRKPNGFVFKEFSGQALHKALERALRVYYNKPNQWRKLQVNGMKKDFSWDRSAGEYVGLYTRLRYVSELKRRKLVK